MDFLLFLLTVLVISLTGVLMPGPVFAAAIVKGAESRHAGAWIALGHIIVEVPLIVLIALGLNAVLADLWVKVGIGIVGGALLVYMGVRMFQIRNDSEVIKRAFPAHPMVAGILTTITNPYFILWWATVGALLITQGLAFGIIGIVAFVVLHESCDLSWDYLVAYTTFRSKKIWTDRTRAYIFGFFGILLAAFGVYFILAFWL